jgi:hypothetical protein
VKSFNSADLSVSIRLSVSALATVRASRNVAVIPDADRQERRLRIGSSSMREENAISRDLSAICTSPGYVHALAYLCFRDSVVRYSDNMTAKDVEHLFSMDRLIRTETSTLIGLMVQQKIDWTLPDAQTIQHYIDETEKLLKELHESMSLPMVEELRHALKSGQDDQSLRKRIKSTRTHLL